MYFDDFRKHKNAKLNKNLFWEYNIEKMNLQQHIEIVVQKVIERGLMEDYYAMFNMFGKKEIVEALKNIQCLTSGEIDFVSHVFKIPKKEMKSYKNRMERPQLWPHLKTTHS